MTTRFVALTVGFLLASAAGPAPATAQAPGSPSPGSVFRDCRSCPEMVVVPGGTFPMGTPRDETGRADNEPDPRPVTVAAFALGRTPITRAEYGAFVRATGYDTNRGTRMGERGCTVGVTVRGLRAPGAERGWNAPGFPQQDRHPVVCVNAADASAYVAWLARRTGKRYRLPSEAEFEYAARAGTTGPQFWAGGMAQACAYANIADASYFRRLNPRAPEEMHLACDDRFGFTSPVARFRANAFGLTDMLGNVEQMTADCPTEQRPGEPPVTPCRWSAGSYGNGPYTRGASWSAGPHRLRVGARGQLVSGVDRDATIGFRVARDL
jgi:formylglycine-generating enzyme required for sulfatase activity